MRSLRYHPAPSTTLFETPRDGRPPLEELRYIALGAAILVGLALPLFPRIGVIGLVMLFPLVTRFIPRAGPGLTASTALFLLAVFAGLLHSGRRLPRIKFVAPFLAFYLLTIVGYAMLAASAKGGFENPILIEAFQVLKARLWPTLLFFAGFALCAERTLRARVLTCIVAGLLFHSFSGIYDFATGGAGMSTALAGVQPSGEDYRAAGILDANPNILGGHLAAFSVLALMGMLERDNRMWLRALSAGAYAISGMVLILTQSRGSWLGFLAAHGVWLFYANRRLLVPAVAAAVVVLVAAYSAAVLPKALSKRIDDTLTPGSALFARQGIAGRFDSSVNIRIAIHGMAADVFSQSPIWGHGFASFPRLALENGAKYGLWGRVQAVSSESILLNTAVESGALGLLIYGWLFWALFSPAFSLMQQPEDRQLAIGFLAVSAAIFVESLTQVALFLPEISLPFWWMAGMVCRAAEEASRVRPA